MNWKPSLGAIPEQQGTRFRVWAPTVREMDVLIEQAGKRSAHPLTKNRDGYFTGLIAGAGAGDRYGLRPDGQGPFPDPASRFQPDGVHGLSEIVNPERFSWSDAGWKGTGMADLSIYELHVGTFTPEGTFAALQRRLPYFADLGVKAIELMPVADFPGRRNWGYDGVDLFAPAHCYGKPDDLRQLLNEAHRLGLAVLLDVVYNHLGPDGNYLGVYSPGYFSQRHQTAWGQALNFDGAHNESVRQFFIENALHWIHEYHFDGLRLDATHAIQDDSPRNFLAELAERVHASAAGRQVLVIAEEHRNLSYMIKPAREGGWDLDGAWIDDFHHQLRRLLAGDSDGYFRDYTGTAADVAATIRQGWFYTGQRSLHLNEPRGTDPSGLPLERLIYCIQNHDQVGNRAFGERLNQQIDAASFRAASTLVLCVPETPLLFMGQEWAAATPFLFFTDHNPELGRLVTEGRRKEFGQFAAFSDLQARERIPDPQDPATFQASRLDWQELEREPHAGMLRLYKALLHLRHKEPALSYPSRERFSVAATGPAAIVLRRWTGDSGQWLIAAQLRGEGTVGVRELGKDWQVILHTEDAAFCSEPKPAQIHLAAGTIRFQRAGAVVFRAGTEK